MHKSVATRLLLFFVPLEAKSSHLQDEELAKLDPTTALQAAVESFTVPITS